GCHNGGDGFQGFAIQRRRRMGRGHPMTAGPWRGCRSLAMAKGRSARRSYPLTGAPPVTSELREIDLVCAGPIQLTVSADLGADILQEASSFGSQSEMHRRWRGLDEAGLREAPHRGRSLGVLRSL